MQKVYIERQARQLEQAAVAAGITEEMMIERAGQATYETLKARWPKTASILVLCGKGKNGGTGYVAARTAQLQGLTVHVRHVGDTKHLSAEVKKALDACEKAGVSIKPFSIDESIEAGLILDAIFGIGLKGRPDSTYIELIHWVNQQHIPVLSIDLPSGVHVDTGNVEDIAVHADCTIAFGGLKQGLLTGDAPDYCGEIVVHDLSLPAPVLEQVKESAYAISSRDFEFYLKPRKRNAHKGYFGHVLVIGSDVGFPGASKIAAIGAARAGAGLVTLATHPAHANQGVQLQPEIMSHPIERARDFLPLFERATVIVIGTGLGRSKWSAMALEAALNANRPLVIDADALHLLAKMELRREDWILVPHPGEAASLLNTGSAYIQQDRYRAVKEIQMQFGGLCILKGAGTLIQTPNTLQVCTSGNPGMASGGMGDLLAGVIAGLYAQGLPLEIAAASGVCLHGEAGDCAAKKHGERGLLATDLIPELRTLVNPTHS
ncbi:MAG: NAD(P)H-hydrate dehydratase [Gammaproteobacteria bacterium]|nr:NAD(P)H-hydrate dehydratase [Gammaproteobacteria bacterium]MBU1558962.1 NAD(P)H-hydrate dehydratase [Gammaproteobacteria bacterium]MBU1926882.1 NAD(P)H-hydrate dehydratase [Gammaproteobacteria bacterium]MBU2546058.1 NAD(P)H-hydrate dehydratase [Gammaproteobacteria bacterium]